MWISSGSVRCQTSWHCAKEWHNLVISKEKWNTLLIMRWQIYFWSAEVTNRLKKTSHYKNKRSKASPRLVATLLVYGKGTSCNSDSCKEICCQYALCIITINVARYTPYSRFSHLVSVNLSVDNRRSKINMGIYGVSSYVLLNWKYLSVCQLSKPLRTRKMGGGERVCDWCVFV